jgi:hypothetical protein
MENQKTPEFEESPFAYKQYTPVSPASPPLFPIESELYNQDYTEESPYSEESFNFDDYTESDDSTYFNRDACPCNGREECGDCLYCSRSGCDEQFYVKCSYCDRFLCEDHTIEFEQDNTMLYLCDGCEPSYVKELQRDNEDLRRGNRCKLIQLGLCLMGAVGFYFWSVNNFAFNHASIYTSSFI